MLETCNLGIRFGGHAAVDGVSCRLQAGALTAIVGPNGAGKTTFFNLVSGQLRATAGSVWLAGRDITHLSAPLRARAGIGRAFQLTQLFANLSVHEHVRLAVQARETGRGAARVEWLRLWSDRGAWTDEADATLRRVHLHMRRDTLARSLTHGDQRKLEVALLIAADPLVYMFDEPTAGMSNDEAPLVLALIAELKQRTDRLVLLVEHKMDVIRALADHILVMHNGQLVMQGTPLQVMRSNVVQRAYLGRLDEAVV